MKVGKVLKGTLAAAALSSLMIGSAYAEETAAATGSTLLTVSSNGYVSIVLPNENWKEVAYDDACVAFSDGKSMITFDHYTNADEEWVPSIPSGDTGFYSRLIDVHEGTKLVFEAYSDSEDAMSGIKTAMAGARVSKEQLPKEEKHSVATEDYSIEACDYVSYIAADELNVRPEGKGDTNAAPIGVLYRGDEVHVTGKIMANGAPNGWVQIEFNGGKGYVSKDFLSDNPVSPNPQPNPNPQSESQPETQGNINGKVDYYDNKYLSDGTPVKVAFLNDGTIVDMNGYPVKGYADATLQMADGTLIYDFDPTKQSLDDFIQGGTVDNNQGETTAAGDFILNGIDGDQNYTGETIVVHEESGIYFDQYGNEVTGNPNGTWYRFSDNTTWQ